MLKDPLKLVVLPMAKLSIKVLYFERYPETTNGHEVAYAKCTSWLPISDNGV